MLKKNGPPGSIPQNSCSLDHFFFFFYRNKISTTLLPLLMHGCSEPVNRVSNKTLPYNSMKVRKQRSSNGKVELDGFKVGRASPGIHDSNRRLC